MKPTREDPVVVRSQRDYMKFAEKHLVDRGSKYTGLWDMKDGEFLAHITKHWGAPESYPVLVWITITEAAEEVGPTFPQTHVHFETKREVKERLKLFD